MKKGVFLAKKKDGTVYYRSSFTYQNKHISLGSFASEELAHKAYLEAVLIMEHMTIGLSDYRRINPCLPFSKWVMLINLRDNKIYFKTPIFLKPKYFEYYLSEDIVLKFDVDDLFFYSTHTIMKRGGHLFVADYGMQLNILNRYGIKNFAVPGKDYRFVNGDDTDFRYINIEIINRYYGVTKVNNNGRITYSVKIHINGDFLIGNFKDEILAAISYNKAVDTLLSHGVAIAYTKNYIEGLETEEYKNLYSQIKLPKKIRDYKL
jgi:hypothetical protein